MNPFIYQEDYPVNVQTKRGSTARIWDGMEPVFLKGIPYAHAQRFLETGTGKALGTESKRYSPMAVSPLLHPGTAGAEMERNDGSAYVLAGELSRT